MSFRLVPKSVTLNDLARRNSPNHWVISPNSIAFPAQFRKSGCRYTDTFGGRIFIAIFAKVIENECVMHKQSHVTGCHHYNITHSLLIISNSTASPVLAWWNFSKLPLTLNSKCYFVVRVRCRPKKFTFAVSSRDELLAFHSIYLLLLWVFNCNSWFRFIFCLDILGFPASDNG